MQSVLAGCSYGNSLSLCILLDILESTAQNRKTQTHLLRYTRYKALRLAPVQHWRFDSERIFSLWWLVKMQTRALVGVTIDWLVGIRSIMVIGQQLLLTQAWGMHCSNIFFKPLTVQLTILKTLFCGWFSLLSLFCFTFSKITKKF